MLEQFLSYTQSQNLIRPGSKVLLGISGGLDSVVLLDLFSRAGIHVTLAHCNFHLRGEESDGDAEFVENLAQDYAVRLYQTDFDTIDYAREQGISIEMAARDLRYDWFEKLSNQLEIDQIAVAHHRDDVLETFFLNLIRGTGIRGLSGIKVKSGKVIRPLLFASREEIIQYANARSLQFREDSSNSDVSIQRNKIRHEILPMFEEINPAFRRKLSETIGVLGDVEQVYKDKVEEVTDELCSYEGELIRISIEKILKHKHPQIYLYEILRSYHFNAAVVEEIYDALTGLTGKQFFSSSHRLIKDREYLILDTLKEDTSDLFYIEAGQQSAEQPYIMDIEECTVDEHFKMSFSSNIAYIDLEKVTFPLAIRKWKKGEYFRPLGMKGVKKLSDFFIDCKMSILEKDQTWLLVNGKHVVWVMGRRLDDRFKITDQTKKVLKITIKEGTSI